MDVCELLNVLSYGFTGTVHGSPQLLVPSSYSYTHTTIICGSAADLFLCVWVCAYTVWGTR
jgi:hypothetical protein